VALALAANIVNNPVVVFFHSVSVSLIRRLFHQRRPSSYHTEGPPSGRTKKRKSFPMDLLNWTVLLSHVAPFVVLRSNRNNSIQRPSDGKLLLAAPSKTLNLAPIRSILKVSVAADMLISVI
jgi:hypothetical protein